MHCAVQIDLFTVTPPFISSSGVMPIVSVSMSMIAPSLKYIHRQFCLTWYIPSRYSSILRSNGLSYTRMVYVHDCKKKKKKKKNGELMKITFN